MACCEYRANQEVIIYSQSLGGWVPARIVSANADDSVTVRYDTGHTKLVPLEYQRDHLRSADEEPPEPEVPESTLVRVVGADESGIFGFPSLLTPPDKGSLGQMPRMQSFEPPPQAASKTKYTVNQQVQIWSESSKGWVNAKVTDVSASNVVTVQYGGNQKLVPPENQHSHLRAVGSASSPPAAQPYASMPLPMPQLGQPRPPVSLPQPSAFSLRPQQASLQPHLQSDYGKSFFVSSKDMAKQLDYNQAAPKAAPQAHLQADYGKSFFVSSSDMAKQLGQQASRNYQQPASYNDSNYNNYMPPPDQMGTFQFDLSALCNDAGQNGAW